MLHFFLVFFGIALTITAFRWNNLSGFDHFLLVVLILGGIVGSLLHELSERTKRLDQLSQKFFLVIPPLSCYAIAIVYAATKDSSRSLTQTEAILLTAFGLLMFCLMLSPSKRLFRSKNPTSARSI